MSTDAAEGDAFVENIEVAPTGSGSLDGLSFAVKDLIDIGGHKTGRLPQVSLPLAESSDGVPVGLSLLAANGRDAFLLNVVKRVAAFIGT